MKIVVLEADAMGLGVNFDSLKQFGEVIIYGKTQAEEIVERIKDADIIIPNKSILNEENLKEAKNLKLICEAATGYNNIDIEYCKKRGIPVTNVVGYSTPIVAQHTFALLLYIYEKLHTYNEYVKNGEYSESGVFTKVEPLFYELSGKKWGIIGMGNIGREVAKIATAFGCEVMYYSASGNTYDVPFQRVELDELLSACDIVSVHCPLNQHTHHLLTYEKFRKMKQTAVLINVARGPVIVDADLAKALNDNLIMGAALDVFEVEPIPKDNPLLNIKDNTKLIMTPHIGWGSLEARSRLIEDIRKSIEAFLNGNPRSVVNQ
ncbi:MAG: D-2-hydroxyacid dehydrogenase [Lachnospiraceae bacterium]|nr:D-2-hydroxyacid dehydrogenase [Lachnospiraceae bacterium]